MLVDVLVHLESSIVKAASTKPQVCQVTHTLTVFSLCRVRRVPYSTVSIQIMPLMWWWVWPKYFEVMSGPHPSQWQFWPRQVQLFWYDNVCPLKTATSVLIHIAASYCSIPEEAECLQQHGHHRNYDPWDSATWELRHTEISSQEVGVRGGYIVILCYVTCSDDLKQPLRSIQSQDSPRVCHFCSEFFIVQQN